MITEDYVSFETAKLLKEKGFYQDYYRYPVYWMNGNNPILSFEGDDDFPYSQNECVAPSLDTAMKWLRNEKNIHIKVHCSGNRNYLVYAQSLVTAFHDFCIESATCSFNTYEEACEAAIKYCLENLI